MIPVQPGTAADLMLLLLIAHPSHLLLQIPMLSGVVLLPSVIKV